jgi:hypothetical protein
VVEEKKEKELLPFPFLPKIYQSLLDFVQKPSHFSRMEENKQGQKDSVVGLVGD